MLSIQIYGVVGAVILFFLIRYLHATDTPKIRNLPEIPGVPLFGNLFQLGTDHARVAQRWAKEYGPVFQTRLGNRVCCASPYRQDVDELTKARELSLSIHTTL